MKAAKCLTLSLAAVLLVQQDAAGACPDPMGTAFTYQGFLACAPGNTAVDGTCDFEFKLYDCDIGGTLIATPTVLDTSDPNATPCTPSPTCPVIVTEGHFVVQLDVGAAAFIGDKRFLEITVSCPSPCGGTATLSPRQELTPVPYALFDGDWDIVSNPPHMFAIPTGNVGIGTSAPTEKLDVDGNIHASGTITSGSSITIDGTANTINSTGDLALQSSGGNVGIGTDTPQRRVHIKGASGGTNETLLALEKDGSWLIGEHLAIDWLAGDINHPQSYRKVLSRIAVEADASGDVNMDFYTTSNVNTGATLIHGMRITDDGKVGIGTKAPTEKLDVNGRVRIRTLPTGSKDTDIVTVDSTGLLHKRAGGAGATVPIGAVIDWYKPALLADHGHLGGTVGPLHFHPPNGYQICDGSPITVGPYAGTSTPDLRDRFVRGISTTAAMGVPGGSDSHLHTFDRPGHAHTIAHNHSISMGSSNSNRNRSFCALNCDTSMARGGHTHATTVSGPSTSNSGATLGEGIPTSEHSNVPAYVGLLKIMRIF